MDTKQQSRKSVLGFLSASALLWAGVVSDAAIPRHQPITTKKVVPVTQINRCKQDLAILQTKGTFQVKGAKTPMAFYMGYKNAKSALAKKLEARLASMDEGAEFCQAVCQLVHFERYRSDGHPQLIQFECSDDKVNALKVPVFIEWTKTESSDYQASIRMGSVFTKTVKAPIAMQTVEPAPVLSAQSQWAKR